MAYQDAIRRRLGVIESMGDDATNRLTARRQAPPSPTSPTMNFADQFNPEAAGGDFSKFLHAIQGQESGGNYGAVNKSSGALGKYQVMPANVANWSKAAIGRAISPQEFLRSPQLQEQVSQYQLRNYYNQFGPAGAAVAWYAGPGNAKKYVASKGRGFTKPQGAYPSVSAYAQSILRKMGLG